jgi:hypothetical protein
MDISGAALELLPPLADGVAGAIVDLNAPIEGNFVKQVTG